MKTILITGGTGQLGISLRMMLGSKYTIISTARSKKLAKGDIFLDVTNSMLYKDILKITNPDLVINLAALTNVDLCEKKPDLAYSINVGGIESLVSVFDGPIIHISTDYVFDGEDGPNKETDNTNPLNIYGASKLASEDLLLDQSKDSLVIRANVLYDYASGSSASFLNWVINSLEKEQEINVVNDQWSNPTWTSSLAIVIDRCIEKRLNGIIHWGDGDWINRFDFAIKIADVFNLKKSLIKPIETSELAQIATRPLKGGLDSRLAQNTLNLEPPTIEECLNTILGQQK